MKAQNEALMKEIVIQKELVSQKEYYNEKLEGKNDDL